MTLNLIGDLYFTWGGVAEIVTAAQPDKVFHTQFYGLGYGKHLLGFHRTTKKERRA